MAHLTMDRQTLKQLKKAYDRARKDGEMSFMYQGNEILTEYAKYLIEFLDTHLTKEGTA